MEPCEADVNPADPGSSSQPCSAWSTLDTFALTSVSTAAAALRLVRLDDPKSLMFDEVYYAKDACWYVLSSPSTCGITEEITLVHPPLGKWLLALGVRLFGYDSFGWRIAAAVAGTLTVMLLFLLARKLLDSTPAAALTSGLLAIDLLHFVESRIAMLDIFVPLFGLAALLFIVYDRDWPHRHASGGSTSKPLLQHPWRVAAGLAGGGAVAAKWSGGFFVVLVLVLCVGWQLARRGDADEREPDSKLRRQVPSILLALVLVPLVVYCSTYIGRLDEPIPRYPTVEEDCPWEQGAWLHNLAHHQLCMLNFHRTLESGHSYESPAWSWIALKRPVAYYFETAPNGDYEHVFASGSPFAWWSSVAALVLVAVAWLRRRGWQEGVILGGLVFTYTPWLIADMASDRSAVFIFYLLPSVPFMCLAVGYVASRLGRSWEAKATIVLFTAAALWFFVFYYPLLAKVPIPKQQWDKRIWVFDDCDKPSSDPTSSVVTETKASRTITRTTFSTGSSDDVPPEGWCWI